MLLDEVDNVKQYGSQKWGCVHYNYMEKAKWFGWTQFLTWAGLKSKCTRMVVKTKLEHAKLIQKEILSSIDAGNPNSASSEEDEEDCFGSSSDRQVHPITVHG